MKKQYTKFIGAIFLAGAFLFFALGSDETEQSKSGTETISTSSEEEPSIESNEGTESCLVGYDWIYPSSGKTTGAWKFSADGTFNSSTTMFGGMSTWGNWSIVGPGKIKVSYTRTTEGVIPDDQVLTMTSCNSLNVGSTTYTKD